MSGFFEELFGRERRRRGEMTMEQLDRLRRELPNMGDLEYDPGLTVASAFPEVSASRGGIKYPTGGAGMVAETMYTNPADPTDSGAEMAVGDMWVDPDNGRVQVWNGSGWTEVVDPAGRGGFWGDGRTGFEAETAEDRWKREAEMSDGDAIRLGEHWARKTEDGGWACEACGGESADAGVLAETDCG